MGKARTSGKGGKDGLGCKEDFGKGGKTSNVGEGRKDAKLNAVDVVAIAQP